MMNNTVTNEILEERILEALTRVMDPEIPFISVIDLGMINSVETDAGSATVFMTPTFAGCPAIHYIQDEIRRKVAEIPGVEKAEVIVDFSNPWSSDRITEKGKKALKEFGLALPGKAKADLAQSFANVACPRCGSTNTTFHSPFGGTLCRALHYCNDCKEAFEQFKPL